ncbi:hypothetical protein KC340_g18 [Hortaea werneckii]|nr:hypothetical protein KC340_g18 [Hortaea werneckii]
MRRQNAIVGIDAVTTLENFPLQSRDFLTVTNTMVGAWGEATGSPPIIRGSPRRLCWVLPKRGTFSAEICLFACGGLGGSRGFAGAGGLEFDETLQSLELIFLRLPFLSLLRRAWDSLVP